MKDGHLILRRCLKKELIIEEVTVVRGQRTLASATSKALNEVELIHGLRFVPIKWPRVNKFELVLVEFSMLIPDIQKNIVVLIFSNSF